MDNIHENQVEEVLPYQFEPEVRGEAHNSAEESGSESESDSEPEEEVDMEFQTENAWRLTDLSWCMCGQCTLSTKVIECFCCHEKALLYDEYDALLMQTETQDCLTKHPDFQPNMLSETVLKIDVSRYLEENWPFDDEELERIHKLYQLVSYQQCSRWVFQILGKGRRRPFPACVYAKIRQQFSSPDGLYTHFKYAKISKR